MTAPMPNSNTTVSGINLSGGLAQYVEVFVTQNAVQPDGSNPGAVDVTTPLTFEGVQGMGTAVNPVEVSPPLASGARVVKIQPGPLAPGSSTQPWSFRVKAAGRTFFVTYGGTTQAPPDISGTADAGVPPSTTQPT